MDEKYRIILNCFMQHYAWRMMAFSAMVHRGGLLFAASVNARAQCVFDVQAHTVAQQMVIRPNVKEFPFCINFN